MCVCVYVHTLVKIFIIRNEILPRGYFKHSRNELKPKINYSLD